MERALRDLLRALQDQLLDPKVPHGNIVLTPELISAMHEGRMQLKRFNESVLEVGVLGTAIDTLRLAGHYPNLEGAMIGAPSQMMREVIDIAARAAAADEMRRERYARKTDKGD